jgi:hypothetical protein
MACNDAIFVIPLEIQDQAGTEMWSFETILKWWVTAEESTQKLSRDVCISHFFIHPASKVQVHFAQTVAKSKVQYRALMVPLGLMGSTPNNCQGVISGIPPLAERFAYLNFRYLVTAFYRLDHPLRERLWVLNMDRCIQGYFDVPSDTFTRYELPAMEKKLTKVQEAMYSLVAPRELLTLTSGYSV